MKKSRKAALVIGVSRHAPGIDLLAEFAQFIDVGFFFLTVVKTA